MIEMRRWAGFTLIELMVVLAVAAVLLSLAVPAMQSFVYKGRARALVTEFSRTLWLVRNQAVGQGAAVTVCPQAAGQATVCGSAVGDWANGWIAYVGRSSDSPTSANILLAVAGKPTLQLVPRGGLTALRLNSAGLGVPSGSNAPAGFVFEVRCSAPSTTTTVFGSVSMELGGLIRSQPVSDGEVRCG
jgi:type IV fimbrial biogenesis protein FimT